MSLDNIQLLGETCSILFNHNLIGDSASNTITNSQEKIEINSLGENQKKVLLLVDDPSCKFLPDEEMELLTNLVNACKLSMADIALVNFNWNKYNYQQFNSQFEPKKMLIFGVTTSDLDLPFDIPYFQVQPFQEQLYLTAPYLKDFLNNTALKKELWKSLQKLFL
ncbi:MAG TPA: hypothetical protein VLS85_01565 [Hanamia sp.]|nr:hypothetical protein [Hanamia sp.]